MSLILEALRKSEERRRLGETPTLISESAWSSRRKHPLARRSRRWLLVLPLLALAAFAGWWLGFRGQREVEPVATRGAPAQTRATAPVAEKPARVRSEPVAAVPAAPEALPQTPEDAAATVQLDPATRERFERGEVFANSPAQLKPVEPTGETPYVPPEAALPQPLPENKPEPVVTVPPAVPDPAIAAATPAIGTEPAPAPASVPAATAAAAPPPEPVAAPGATAVDASAAPAASVQLIWELPAATRRALPPMNLSMHVYSADPERRFAWIDDKRVTEGSPLKNDLDVLEITPEGVVLQFQGQRFLLPRAGR